MNKYLNCTLYEKDTNKAINTYNFNGLKLIESKWINIDEFFILGTGMKSELILVERYRFFQEYLDGHLKINNAYFIIGNNHSFNAWAIGREDINIISINAHVFLNNYLFYETRNDEINKLLVTHGIKLTYDNGVNTTKIMMQIIEMYLFYHETAHLIQAQPPIFTNERNQEILSNSCNAFNILDHVAEIDADLYANIKIATHMLKIIDRGCENSINTENFVAVVIASYLVYRNLILNSDMEFYTKKYDHPHLIIRMIATIKDISSIILQETSYSLDQNRLINLCLDLLEGLCNIHPLISFKSNMSLYLQANTAKVTEYYGELISEVVKNRKTAYAKTRLL